MFFSLEIEVPQRDCSRPNLFHACSILYFFFRGFSKFSPLQVKSSFATLIGQRLCGIPLGARLSRLSKNLVEEIGVLSQSLAIYIAAYNIFVGEWLSWKIVSKHTATNVNIKPELSRIRPVIFSYICCRGIPVTLSVVALKLQPTDGCLARCEK